MAWQDRDYYREEQSVGFGSRLSGQSVVTWLLIVNTVVFVLDSVLTGSGRGHWLSPTAWGEFRLDRALTRLELWRLVTYQFLHAGFLHVFFNMLGLYFFGPMVEQRLGGRRFLAFYLLCGMSGAVLFSLAALVPGLLDVSWNTGLVGASGSVFGVLVAAAVIAPRQRVMLLFPPIPMQLRTMVLAFLALAALSLLSQAINAGGEAAHLGGAALGFLLIKRPRLLNFADFSGFALQRLSIERKRRRAMKDQENREREDAEVDRILAKVKDHGLHSLTEGEKRTLHRATERQRHAG